MKLTKSLLFTALLLVPLAKLTQASALPLPGSGKPIQYGARTKKYSIFTMNDATAEKALTKPGLLGSAAPTSKAVYGKRPSTWAPKFITKNGVHYIQYYDQDGNLVTKPYKNKQTPDQMVHQSINAKLDKIQQELNRIQAYLRNMPKSNSTNPADLLLEGTTIPS